ncbi:hypothetical protein J6590_096306 [Homalodisca vitripennis]|nr:hypothetical protein J6590_096306 [Homalodisca vitripennis]
MMKFVIPKNVFMTFGALLVWNLMTHLEENTSKPRDTNLEFLREAFNQTYFLVEQDEAYYDVLLAGECSSWEITQGNYRKERIILRERDGVFTLKSIYTFSDHVVQFRLGEWFREVHPEWNARSVITQDLNELIQERFLEMFPGDSRHLRIVRRFEAGNILNITVTFEEESASSIYTGGVSSGFEPVT